MESLNSVLFVSLERVTDVEDGVGELNVTATANGSASSGGLGLLNRLDNLLGLLLLNLLLGLLSPTTSVIVGGGSVRLDGNLQGLDGDLEALDLGVQTLNLGLELGNLAFSGGLVSEGLFQGDLEFSLGGVNSLIDGRLADLGEGVLGQNGGEETLDVQVAEAGVGREAPQVDDFIEGVGVETVVVAPLTVAIDDLDGDVGNTPVRANELVNESPVDGAVGVVEVGGVDQVQGGGRGNQILVQTPQTGKDDDIRSGEVLKVNVDGVLGNLGSGLLGSGLLGGSFLGGGLLGGELSGLLSGLLLSSELGSSLVSGGLLGGLLGGNLGAVVRGREIEIRLAVSASGSVVIDVDSLSKSQNQHEGDLNLHL